MVDLSPVVFLGITGVAAFYVDLIFTVNTFFTLFRLGLD